MGASLDCRIFKTDNREEIKREWTEEVEISREESGNSYSGCIGMLGSDIARWHDARFDSPSKAEEWLSENHQKWNGGLAVSFKIAKPPTAAQTAKIAKLRAKIEDLHKQASSIEMEGLTAIVNAVTPKLVGCSTCKSRIARSYMKGVIRCPVCHGSLLGKSSQKKIAKLRGKATEIQKVVLDLAAGTHSDKIGWVIGGWCSS